MPSKGKRTAARQAQLSQKRHRGERRAPLPQVLQDAAPAAPGEPTAERAIAEPRPPRRVAAVPTAAQPSPARASQLQQIAPYVKRELRRIGLLTGLLLVILVAVALILPRLGE